MCRIANQKVINKIKKYDNVQQTIHSYINQNLNKDLNKEITKIGENVLELQAKLHIVVSEASKPI